MNLTDEVRQLTEEMTQMVLDMPVFKLSDLSGRRLLIRSESEGDITVTAAKDMDTNDIFIIAVETLTDEVR